MALLLYSLQKIGNSKINVVIFEYGSRFLSIQALLKSFSATQQYFEKDLALKGFKMKTLKGLLLKPSYLVPSSYLVPTNAIKWATSSIHPEKRVSTPI